MSSRMPSDEEIARWNPIYGLGAGDVSIVVFATNGDVRGRQIVRATSNGHPVHEDLIQSSSAFMRDQFLGKLAAKLGVESEELAHLDMQIVEAAKRADEQADDEHRVGEPEIVSLADVEAVPIEWLWQSRVPLGKLTVICGDPGLGKGLVTADIVATVTTGGSLPR